MSASNAPGSPPPSPAQLAFLFSKEVVSDFYHFHLVLPLLPHQIRHSLQVISPPGSEKRTRIRLERSNHHHLTNPQTGLHPCEPSLPLQWGEGVGLSSQTPRLFTCLHLACIFDSSLCSASTSASKQASVILEYILPQSHGLPSCPFPTHSSPSDLLEELYMLMIPFLHLPFIFKAITPRPLPLPIS